MPELGVVAGHLEVLASEMPELRVTRQSVDTAEAAERLGFVGSPSILVDGVDLFAEPCAPVGLACRIYRTPAGPAGAPTLDQLRAGLTRGSGPDASTDASGPDERRR